MWYVHDKLIVDHSRNSSVGIATGWMAGVRFPARATDFSLLHRVQTSSGAHPVPVQRVPGALSSGVKLPGHEADHSSPSSAEVKNRGSMPPLTHTSSWRCA
jgi:hypothetical protein